MNVRFVALLLLAGCSKGTSLLPADCRPSVQGPTLTLPVELDTSAKVPIVFSNPLPLPLEVNQLSLTEGEGFTFTDDRRSLLVPAGSCDRPGTLTLELEFTATKLVAQRATLSGVMGTDPFSLTVSATGNGPRFEAPSAFTFGPVALAPVERGLPVRNIGTVDSALVVKLTAVRALNAETNADELCVGTLVNGACLRTTRFTVTRQELLPLRLLPSSPGEKSWQLILTPETRAATPITVTISARVVDERGCALEASPRRLGFGLTPMERQLLQVRNIGSTPCILRGARIDDNPAFTVSGPTNLVLEPSRAVELTVGANFGSTSSLRGATLVVEAPPRGLQVPIAFDLGGPECLTLPTRLDFAPAVAGCISAPRSITLANQCSRPLVLKRVSATAPFVIANLPAISPAGLPLQPGVMPTIIGLSTQGGADAGASTGQLVIEVVGGVLTVPLTGGTTPRRELVDSFSFERSPSDWVFVLDDSASFLPHHAHVRRQLDRTGQLFETLGTNARLGVTTTSVSQNAGVLRTHDGGQPWVTSGAPDFTARWRELSTLSTGGDEHPSCVEAALRSLDGGVTFRPNASLQLVCITDDVDVSPTSFLNPLADGRATYSVVGPFDPSCPTVTTDDGGHRDAVNLGRGMLVDLCSNWADLMFQRSSFGYRTTFTLSAQPDISSLSVEFDGVVTPAQRVDGGVAWQYLVAENAISVQPLDQPALMLTIRYRTPCQ